MFWGVNGNIELSGDDERRKEFRSRNVNGIYKNAYQEIYQSINGELSVAPSLGFGRKRPVEPVYQAFLIEHKLKKSGCIKGNLSDSTMYRLVGLTSSVEAYKLKNEKYVKFLMSDIEKIILKDSAVVDSTIDAFALFRLHEVFEIELPFFYCGPSVYISWSSRGRIGLSSSYISYEPDQSYDLKNGDFDVVGMPDVPYLNLEYTFPLLTTVFAELKIGLPILTQPNFTGIYDRKYTGEAALYCMLLNKLILDCGIEANNDNRWKYKELSNYSDHWDSSPVLKTGPNECWIASGRSVYRITPEEVKLINVQENGLYINHSGDLMMFYSPTLKSVLLRGAM